MAVGSIALLGGHPHATFGTMSVIEARYENGVLKPSAPLHLRPGERVGLVVLRRPDPKRWDLERLARPPSPDEAALTEEGLSTWAGDLDAEDDR